MGEDSAVLDADAIFRVLPRSGHRIQPLQPASAVQPLAKVMAQAEAGAIEAALLASRGNRSRAAQLLGISRSALYEKLAKLSGL